MDLSASKSVNMLRRISPTSSRAARMLQAAAEKLKTDDKYQCSNMEFPASKQQSLKSYFRCKSPDNAAKIPQVSELSSAKAVSKSPSTTALQQVNSVGVNSPSPTGILKRRLLAESPNSPYQKRKVSFANPLTRVEEVKEEHKFNPSGVKTGFNRCLLPDHRTSDDKDDSENMAGFQKLDTSDDTKEGVHPEAFDSPPATPKRRTLRLRKFTTYQNRRNIPIVKPDDCLLKLREDIFQRKDAAKELHSEVTLTLQLEKIQLPVPSPHKETSPYSQELFETPLTTSSLQEAHTPRDDTGNSFCDGKQNGAFERRSEGAVVEFDSLMDCSDELLHDEIASAESENHIDDISELREVGNKEHNAETSVNNMEVAETLKCVETVPSGSNSILDGAEVISEERQTGAPPVNSTDVPIEDKFGLRVSEDVCNAETVDCVDVEGGASSTEHFLLDEDSGMSSVAESIPAESNPASDDEKTSDDSFPSKAAEFPLSPVEVPAPMSVSELYKMKFKALSDSLPADLTSMSRADIYEVQQMICRLNMALITEIQSRE